MNRDAKRFHLIAGLALACVAGSVAAGELQPLSDSEMSEVAGRGMVALQALGRQEQDAAFVSAGDATAALNALSAQAATNMERELAQQQMQTATVGLQAAIRLTQTLATVSSTLAPLGALNLGSVAMPGLFGLGALGGLSSLGGLASLPGLSQYNGNSNNGSSPPRH